MRSLEISTRYLKNCHGAAADERDDDDVSSRLEQYF